MLGTFFLQILYKFEKWVLSKKGFSPSVFSDYFRLPLPTLHVYCTCCCTSPIDDNLWIIFSVEFLNEALRSPNHKTCFSFAQKCLEDLLQFHPFSPFSTQPYQNGQANCKSYRHFRAKRKHVLWLEDLKASLRNCTEKIDHKSSSNLQNYSFFLISYENSTSVYVSCGFQK